MFKTALLIAAKDLRLTLGSRRSRAGASVPLQAFILGLLIIFMFSLAPAMSLTYDPGSEGPLSPALAAILFWMSSLSAQALIVQHLYGLEHSDGVRLLLRAAPIAPQAVWLGKTLAGFALLLLMQIALCPVLIMLLEQSVDAAWPTGVLGIVLADFGLAGLGALLGAFPVASSAAERRSFLPAILGLPLLIPMLIAAAQLFQAALIPDAAVVDADALTWLGILSAFDALTLGVALALFPFVFMED